MVEIVPWYAQWAKVGIGSVIASVNATQTLKTQFDALSDEIYYTGRCKNVSITGGSRDVSKVDLLGANQAVQRERPDMVQVEMTLVYDETTTGKFTAGTASTSFTVTEGTTRTYTRYNYGEKTLASLDRSQVSLLFVLDDMQDTATNAKKVNILVNNAFCTTTPEITLNADGHVEEKLTFKALVSNRYDEDNFTQSTW